MSKFNEYVVKTTNTNGKISEVANSTNFKECCVLYKGIKEKHIDDSAIVEIKMIGRNCKEEYVFYSKAINVKKKNAVLNQDCRELVKQTMENITILKQQKEYFEKLLPKYDKQLDTLGHKIELLHNKEFVSNVDKQEYYMSLFNEIVEIREKRRLAKSQILDLKNIGRALDKLDFAEIKEFVNPREEYTLSPEAYQKNAQKEVRYNSNTQRQIVLEKFENKFDKYVDDEENQTIFFYNCSALAKRKWEKNKAK